jgi:lipopolysaccharide/colanic/teichoic acid biosynthesis glycosyltransferase
VKLQKRLFDLIGASLGLVILAPLMAVIALMVKTQGRGPVFFRQVRVGRQGEPFRLWKFRTMVPNADQTGMPLTVGQDARVTPTGAWLRRLKLDELPQLFNVVAGEMSLVGPRPEVPRYVACYDAEQGRVLGLVPGLTDEASLRYCRESELLATVPDPERFYIETLLPEKIRISLAYAERATLWSDVRIILATLGGVFGSSGTDPSGANPIPTS